MDDTAFYPDAILRGAGVYVDTYAYDNYKKYDMTGVRGRGIFSLPSPFPGPDGTR